MDLLEKMNQRQHALDAGSTATEDFLPLVNGDESIRLNLGSGDSDRALPGWVNLDRRTGQEVYPLSHFGDNTVDEVRASHVLEHFSHRDTAKVLAEWVRVLKPGGVLKVAVPDFEVVAHNYLLGKAQPTEGFVMGSHADANDFHGAIFDEEELYRRMRVAGLWDIHPWKSEIKDCAALDVSLNLQGRKKPAVPSKIKVACALSVPRLGFMDNFFCWAKALQPLGITPTCHSGAFWGQCLERTMMEQLDNDFILTMDYDTVFTRDAVEDLILLALEHPEVDAFAPVQIRRGLDTPLFMMRGEDGRALGEVDFNRFKADLVPVVSAHFGLTLIRVAALKKMPHPWFLPQPDKDGGWGENRMDEDVYFWRQWELAGHKLCVAPHVVVAHGQMMLAWPGRATMAPIYQHPGEFQAKGKPEGAWR